MFKVASPIPRNKRISKTKKKKKYKHLKALNTLPGKELSLQPSVDVWSQKLDLLYSINADSIVYFLYVDNIIFTDCSNRKVINSILVKQDHLQRRIP